MAELNDLGFGEVSGADVSTTLIARGRRAHPDLRFERITSPPVLDHPAGSFDLIVLFAVLTCVPDDAAQRGLVAAAPAPDRRRSALPQRPGPPARRTQPPPLRRPGRYALRGLHHRRRCGLPPPRPRVPAAPARRLPRGRRTPHRGAHDERQPRRRDPAAGPPPLTATRPAHAPPTTPGWPSPLSRGP
ncbi:class I SAM-dependent methyltransferase [Actinoplanes xinjiangensis]|uniref:class I SAM-dependent methyltransferase n=1 Tax=Actinoplanes xinjiangensis TaxID=512350 RepID=UPI001EF33387|nr:class I SAM-dependent methyltransferase [Actinoplanes xinjiangensis]